RSITPRRRRASRSASRRKRNDPDTPATWPLTIVATPHLVIRTGSHEECGLNRPRDVYGVRAACALRLLRGDHVEHAADEVLGAGFETGALDRHRAENLGPALLQDRGELVERLAGIDRVGDVRGAPFAADHRQLADPAGETRALAEEDDAVR